MTPAELSHWGHCDAQFSAFYAPLAPGEPARAPCHPDLTERERRTVFMACLFPSLVIALSPERVFYMCIIPVETGRVRTRWGVASYGEEFTNHTLADVAAFYRQVNEEDRVRLESIQRGVRGALRGARADVLARDDQHPLRGATSPAGSAPDRRPSAP